ncbi:MAG TPA: DoxX family protein [Polyangiaceae bacterium]|nr:DoxX family protein [Polyangiaceae bacterium]
MKTTLEALRRKTSRPSVGFDLLRVYLGVALFVRGALFVADPDRLMSLVGRSGDWFMPMLVAHYVSAAHICGGILLALGVATRIAALVQVPVLLGAVFFVHWGDGLLRAGQSLELAGLVLAMLLAYSVCGAGPLSFDHWVRERQRAESTKRPRLRRRLTKAHA